MLLFQVLFSNSQVKKFPMNAILKLRMAQLLKVAFTHVSFALMLLSRRWVLKIICFLILMNVLLNVLSAVKDSHKNIIYSIIYWYIKISSLLNVRFANKDFGKVILWSFIRRSTIIRNCVTTCIYILLYLNGLWYLYYFNKTWNSLPPPLILHCLFSLK